jgi:seryl-tRNA synthetase
MSPTPYDAKQFFDGLVANGLIFPGRVLGTFGRSGVFEDVLDRVNLLITSMSAEPDAEPMMFPPVIDRQIIEKTDYLDSFPHLTGAVFSFFGKELASKQLAARARAGEPWGDGLGMTDVCLAPAACYPVYPMMARAGALPERGRTISLTGWAFRHEPSEEPTRMQAFRVREYIRAGSPDACVEWRDKQLERGVEILRALGLPATTDIAADPFFGRAGKLMADGQKAQKLKFEVLVPVISESEPTAVCSFNYHQDKFGSAFGIQTSGGETAHTACLGYGMERVVMALFRHHGFAPTTWPQPVRARLWP